LPDAVLERGVIRVNIRITFRVSDGRILMHVCILLIPKRDNDTANSRGGVHGVSFDKGRYRVIKGGK